MGLIGHRCFLTASSVLLSVKLVGRPRDRMIARRRFLTGLLAFLATRHVNAQSRQFRVGYLLQVPLTDPPSPERASFLERLREIGYVVGKNLSLDYRSAENEPEFLEDLARELAREKPDVIVTASSVPAAQAAVRVTQTIPIVFIGVPDPVAIGLVSSLSRPGGNVTGVAWEPSNLIGKRLELLRSVVPRLQRLAVMWNPSHGEAARQIVICRKLLRDLGISSDEYAFDGPSSLDRAFGTMAQRRPDAIYVISDPRIVTHRRTIASELLQLRLPSIFSYAGYVDDGGLMSYAAVLSELYRRAADYVDRILRGAKPSDLPIEQPTKLELVINLKTAKTLDLTVPQSVLLRADRVIE